MERGGVVTGDGGGRYRGREGRRKGKQGSEEVRDGGTEGV